MKNKILKGQYFYYTIGAYSSKNYYLVKALKDIDNKAYEGSNKILRLVVKILSSDKSCCQNENWMCDKCDNCAAGDSALLFLAILDIQGLIEFTPTYGEINYNEYSDIEEAVDIDFDVATLDYEGNYDKIKAIASKVINEDLKDLSNG